MDIYIDTDNASWGFTDGENLVIVPNSPALVDFLDSACDSDIIAMGRIIRENSGQDIFDALNSLCALEGGE